MSKRIKQLSKQLLISLITIVVYGLVLYLVCTWLAGYSLLYAYLGNLALIIIVLTLDELTLKMFQSEKRVEQVMSTDDAEKTYHQVQLGLENFVTFKTELYLFYVLVLIFSQIIDLAPLAVGEDLGTFFHINGYSILLLLAIDMFIGQFSKDKDRLNRILDRFKGYLTKNQDK